MCSPKSNMYLLGAGFTSIITCGKSPDMSSLYDKVIGVVPPEILARYKDLNKDIEKLLTLIEIDINTGSPCIECLRKAREQVKEKILEVLDFDNIKPETNDAGEAFLGILKKDDVVISLNYDIVLERFLWNEGKGIWSPDTGYTHDIRNDFYTPTASSQNINKLNIEIIKPHGSVNFIEGYVDWEKTGNTNITLEISEKYFPNIHAELSYMKEFQAGRKILIPAYIKPEIFHQAIANLWYQAFERVKNSKNLFIIGCGLRSADVFVWWLLYLFIRNKDKKIIILDRNAEALKESILKMLKIPEVFVKGQIVTLQKDVSNNFDILKKYI